MIENNIANSMFQGSSEKTYIDKLLGKQDIDRLAEIMKKDNLERHDVKTILYYMASSESKLWNLDEWTRYILLKLYVWIRDFVKNFEILFDYEDDLNKKKKKGIIDDKTYKNNQKLLYNNKRMMTHNLNFLIDLYMNIARTTLSVGATGFLEPLHNKYEISYPEQGLQHKENKGGMLRK